MSKVFPWCQSWCWQQCCLLACLVQLTCFKTVLVQAERSVNDRKCSMRWEKNREPELFFAPVSSQHSSVSVWTICCMCMPVPAPTPHLVVPEWAMLYENTKGELNTTQEVGFIFYILVLHTWNTLMDCSVRSSVKMGWRVFRFQPVAVRFSSSPHPEAACLLETLWLLDTHRVPKLTFWIKNLPFFTETPQYYSSCSTGWDEI